MKRFQSVSNIQLNTIGRAALLDMLFTDGSSQAIEIECDKIGELMSAMLKTCAMLGNAVPNGATFYVDEITFDSCRPSMM